MKRLGKPLPHLVLRPYQRSLHTLLDNQCMVFAYEGFDFKLIIAAVSLLFIVTGIALFLGATITKENWAVEYGSLCFFVGGGGFIWSWYSLKISSNFTVFDRISGTVRFMGLFRKENKVVKEFQEVPFKDCEARIYRIDRPEKATFMTGLSIYTPDPECIAYDHHFGSRAHALGFWSFLVQFMDKDAPLPDIPHLAGYPNRTKGAGTKQAWEKAEKRKDFIDPLDVWEGRVGFSPSEKKDAFLAKFQPKNQSIDVAKSDNPNHDLPSDPENSGIIPLPKKVLRPFIKYVSARCDEYKTILKRRQSFEKYYYILCWSIFCAGLALFSVKTSAALLTILAAIAVGVGLWLLRRTKGIVLDRKKQCIVFHEGPLYTPIVIPFKECEGRLKKTNHKEGFSSYGLYVHHSEKGEFNLAENWTWNLNHLLGLWSFIVQYLDKKAPLPDIDELQNYPDREPGIGSWDEFAKRSGEPGFVDPYFEWLKTTSR